MERARRNKLAACGALFALASTSACAPVALVDADVSVEIQMNENAGIAGSYLVAELPDTGAFPITTPRAYDAEQLCMVLSVTGSGLPQIFAETQDLSCESRFPGLGQMSDVFVWGEQPEIRVGYGERQFDVVGFPKHLFPGRRCPSEIRAESDANGKASFFADGQAMSFPEGASGPVRVAASRSYVSPGRNVIDLTAEKADSGRLIGRNYGCRRFDVSPRPTESNLYVSGLREYFFEVQCPSDADRVRIETDGGYTSPTYLCDAARGTVRVPSIPMNDFDLEASEWGWFEPTIKINALMGNAQVGSLTYRVHYSAEGHYPAVIASSDASELNWFVSEADREFRIADYTNGELVVHEHDPSSGLVREHAASIDLAANGPATWNGQNPSDESIGASPLFDSSLLEGETVGWKVDGAGKVRVRRCADGSETCPANWQGLEVGVAENQFGFDVFGSIGASPMLWLVDVVAGAPRVRTANLNSASWSTGSYSTVAGAASAALFYPEWNDPEVTVVRAQRQAQAKSDPLLSIDQNLVAAGSAEDPEYPGYRRSVVYRTFDSGKTWYQVYRGPLGSQISDGSSLAVAGQDRLVFLERYRDWADDEYVRVIAQDPTKTGF